jgi:Domain of unknown function (DUF4395)
MLRFDLPRVWSQVIRLEAFLTFSICWLALFISPWFLTVLVLQGLVRGFIGHNKCPSHLLWKQIFQHLGWGGKLEDAGAKMFANKILFISSSIALTLFLLELSLWRMPVIALICFSFLEWALSFCAACWAYGVWYKRFPPI